MNTHSCAVGLGRMCTFPYAPEAAVAIGRSMPHGRSTFGFKGHTASLTATNTHSSWHYRTQATVTAGYCSILGGRETLVSAKCRCARNMQYKACSRLAAAVHDSTFSRGMGYGLNRRGFRCHTALHSGIERDSSGFSSGEDPHADKWAHMRNIALVISYDGTRLHGFQLQANRETIQLHLERALCNVTRESRKQLRLVAAGRTDAGVHALGQVVNILTERHDMDLDGLVKSVNGQLPWAIRVLAAADVPSSFHARFCATQKTYLYHIQHNAEDSPFLYRYRTRYRRPLNVDSIRDCSQLFVGKQDFTQFANLSVTERDPIKTLKKFDVQQREDGVLRFEVQGNAFLYKQVRHMVGACCAVAEGKMALEDVQRLLQVGSSKPIGRKARMWTVAEAQGLMLARVEYPQHFNVPMITAANPLP